MLQQLLLPADPSIFRLLKHVMVSSSNKSTYECNYEPIGSAPVFWALSTPSPQPNSQTLQALFDFSEGLVLRLNRSYLRVYILFSMVGS